MPAVNSVIKVLTYPSCFQLVVGEDKSDLVEYGALVELESGGKVYGACFAPEGSQTTAPVWEAKPVKAEVVPEPEDPIDWDSEGEDEGEGEEEEEEEGDEGDDEDDVDDEAEA